MGKRTSSAESKVEGEEQSSPFSFVGEKMTLELLDGTTIAPLNVFDVLDTVEEYLGTDVREFLEEYFTDGDPWESLPDDEKTRKLQDHYNDVFEALDDLVFKVDRVVQTKPINRKRAASLIAAIKNLIERNYHI